MFDEILVAEMTDSIDPNTLPWKTSTNGKAYKTTRTQQYNLSEEGQLIEMAKPDGSKGKFRRQVTVNVNYFEVEAGAGNAKERRALKTINKAIENLSPEAQKAAIAEWAKNAGIELPTA
jgi:hypothetical protein